jgi:hypothetical protein
LFLWWTLVFLGRWRALLSTSRGYSQHARVPRTSGTDIGEPALNRLFHVSCCGSSVSMRGYSFRGVLMSKSKATDDCNLRFDVGPAVEVVTSCGRSLVYPPRRRCVRLVWDIYICGTTSQGICCQGLGPLHGTDIAGFTSRSLEYHAGS